MLQTTVIRLIFLSLNHENCSNTYINVLIYYVVNERVLSIINILHCVEKWSELLVTVDLCILKLLTQLFIQRQPQLVVQ